MRLFFYKLLLIIPIPLFVVSLNLFVDPVNITNRIAYETGLVQLLLEDHNVTNINEHDEAMYLRLFVNGLQNRKDVLVLGSSRSKLIRQGLFSGKSLFNNSVSGGDVQDYLAVYSMYERRKLIPSIVIIELSPWVVDRRHHSVWDEFNNTEIIVRDDTIQILEKGEEESATLASMVQENHELLSIGYFQTSFYTWLRALLKPTSSGTGYYIYAESGVPIGETILRDGSALYPERIQNQREKARVMAEAIKYATQQISYGQLIDHDKVSRLESFIRYLAGKHIEIIVYLPPYHPKVYEMLVNAPNFHLKDIQALLTRMAERYSLKMVGSYNPRDVGFSEDDFFDGSHPNQYAVKKMFTSNLSQSVPPRVEVQAGQPRVQIVGIDNPNGLEVSHQKYFFWIGNGETCLNIRSDRVGRVTLSFTGTPGPSLGSTRTRNLLLTTQTGFTDTVVIDRYPSVEIEFPVSIGFNAVCLQPLDKPNRVLANDKRVLLLGVTDPTVKISE